MPRLRQDIDPSSDIHASAKYRRQLANVLTRRVAHARFFRRATRPMKIYDLSQPLNEQFPFWPYYPPFEVKYIKRKAEHGVNAQYIMTSNHMGTHLDAPRHFVTNGRTIDEIPVEWLCGPGVIVNLSDVMGELELYTPKMIEDRVEVQRRRSCCICTRASTNTRSSASTPTRRNTSIAIPARIPTWCRGCSKKEIHIWGVDCVSTDHPMNLPIGRFLGKGQHGHCDRVRKQAEEKFGGKEAVDKLFPDSAYQLTHNALFPERLHAHRESRRRHRRSGAAEQAADPRMLPVEVQRRRGGVLPRGRVRRANGRSRERACRSVGVGAAAPDRRARGRRRPEVVEACLERVDAAQPGSSTPSSR